ncbi:ACT domain-containing protein [Rouxiella sp. Mn2063]|uniref:ACT domain-containing protein n=1 Tax=Rouxiella sp. Mn2063 TaxID=3395262 RepID=UPI003BD822E8
MTGITDLNQLLASMEPSVSSDIYVFCTTTSLSIAELVALEPKGMFSESEGMTVILNKASALKNNLPFSGEFSQITLTVHSSLEAVGLTAAVSDVLAKAGVSANVVAAYYHDHIFVQREKQQIALKALQDLQISCQAQISSL